MPSAADAATVERVFREESGRAVATLVRLFGDIDIAEEAVQEAFVVATRALAGDGRAAEPGRLDRHHRPQPGHRPAAARVVARTTATRRPPLLHERDEDRSRIGPVSDDRLRLIFTCCHPALAAERAGRAHAAAARRARRRPRSPAPSSCPRRRWRSGSSAPSARSATPTSRTASPTTPSCPTGSAPVLAVVYLIFNEGYTASSGDVADPRRPAAPRRSASPACSSS